MPDAALLGLAATASIALATWAVSVVRRDASIVDSVWSLMILAAGIAYGAAPWVLVLAAVWALRLAGHIAWRNHGQPEDRRYQAIRARNQPHFALKSLYLVFGVQAVLAWVVSMPFLPKNDFGWMEALGAALAVTGVLLETVADLQLARFKADPANRGKVMDRGLWRYSRHPNYFGEFCVWWGFWLAALPAGWWAIVSPLLVSFLLLKVSGVTLLEKDIAERRPGYRDYVARTSAFFPWVPR